MVRVEVCEIEDTGSITFEFEISTAWDWGKHLRQLDKRTLKTILDILSPLDRDELPDSKDELVSGIENEAEKLAEEQIGVPVLSWKIGGPVFRMKIERKICRVKTVRLPIKFE